MDRQELFEERVIFIEKNTVRFQTTTGYLISVSSWLTLVSKLD